MGASVHRTEDAKAKTQGVLSGATQTQKVKLLVCARQNQPLLLAIETSVNITHAATTDSARRLAIQSAVYRMTQLPFVDGNATCRASFRLATHPVAASASISLTRRLSVPPRFYPRAGVFFRPSPRLNALSTPVYVPMGLTKVLFTGLFGTLD
jgi:hypothetical protein